VCSAELYCLHADRRVLFLVTGLNTEGITIRLEFAEGRCTRLVRESLISNAIRTNWLNFFGNRP